MIKAGFIGAGNHATWSLYPALQHVPAFKLMAVCDLDEGRAKSAADRFGIPSVYTDYLEMLDCESLDALFCCGGPKLHAMVIAEAIKRDLSLFVEKPPAPTAAEVLTLAQQADESDAKVMIGFMHRFAHATNWARKAIESDDFGKVMMCYAREGIWGTGMDTLVMDSGIHHLDLLLALAGRVASVQSRSVTNGESRHGYAAMLQFANGALGQVGLNSLEALGTPSDIIEIHGDRGQWLRIDNWQRATLFRDPQTFVEPPNELSHANLQYEHSWTAAGVNQSAVLQGYAGELLQFERVVKGDAAAQPDLRDGFRAMQLVEAIRESAAKDGASVTLEDPFV